MISLDVSTSVNTSVSAVESLLSGHPYNVTYYSVVSLMSMGPSFISLTQLVILTQGCPLSDDIYTCIPLMNHYKSHSRPSDGCEGHCSELHSSGSVMDETAIQRYLLLPCHLLTGRV